MIQRVLTGQPMVPPVVRVTADPAANAEWSYTVPAGELLELVMVTAVLVQGAVQTPWPILKITDGTNLIIETPAGSSAPAINTTVRCNWHSSNVTTTVGATTEVHIYGAIPDGLLLGPGFVVSSYTYGIGGNTNWGPASLLVVTH